MLTVDHPEGCLLPARCFCLPLILCSQLRPCLLGFTVSGTLSVGFRDNCIFRRAAKRFVLRILLPLREHNLAQPCYYCAMLYALLRDTLRTLFPRFRGACCSRLDSMVCLRTPVITSGTFTLFNWLSRLDRHRTSQGTGPHRKSAYYVVRYLSYSVNRNLSSVLFLSRPVYVSGHL